MRNFFHISILPFCLVALVTAASPAFAQFDLLGDNPPGDSPWGQAAEEVVVEVAAEFTAPTAEKPAGLFITATIKPGWHIYSITQPPGGPVRTKIDLKESDEFQLGGSFRAVTPPEKKREKVFDNLMVESHYRTVTWYAPLEVSFGVDPASLQIEGHITAQPCDANGCLMPQDFAFTAVFGRGRELPADWRTEPPEPLPAEPPAESQVPEAESPAAAQAAVKHDYELPWKPFTTISAFTALTSDGTTAFDPELTKASLANQVAGTSLMHVLSAMLLGFVGGLILNVMPCVLPVIGLKILSFVEQAGHDRKRAFMLNVWYSLGLMSIFMVLATLAVVAGLGWGQLFSYKEFTITLALVVFVMGLSFLGVWEIPIPGFVGRGKAAELAEKEGAAGAFSKGALTTVLATPCSAPFLAPALTWALHQPPLLIYLIFFSVGLGMASPYLMIGAFPKLIAFLPKPGAWMETFKQIMGFVLLGTVVFILTWLEFQYIVPAIGLLFGLWAACWWIGRVEPTADSRTKAWAWLEAAAFAGVVWLLMFPGIDEIYPGRYSFGGLADVTKARYDRKIDYQLELVLAARMQPSSGSRQNTLLVDFTADWCLTCKTLEATVLNTPAVREAIERNGVVTLQADWTHGQPEVTKMLDVLGSKQVPVIAIFPAGNPNAPIVFRGGYTQQMLLDALEEAGPSKPLL